jgi:hypothetical protein
MMPNGSSFHKDRTSPVEPATILSVGDGRTAVALSLVRQGRDWIVTVTGGDAHVGAVAVESPAGGTRGEGCRSLTVVPGHKEGPLAEQAATRLAAVADRTVVAVVGIHRDDATRAEIAAIVANVAQGVERLAEQLAGAAGETPSTGKDGS